MAGASEGLAGHTCTVEPSRSTTSTSREPGRVAIAIPPRRPTPQLRSTLPRQVADRTGQRSRGKGAVRLMPGSADAARLLA
jgi:hypothetical protein